ncbi:uncharacterized protein EMH_0012540 [Eimeria mitis]|uniref:Uncharacterized protein n=1 Tax=Eimeria mitis TaxID=44415 RepID=U6K6K1_9EIME|nr:uncharacterized protein EMH_0012540 [Eimeria mitis]CDJ32451.1 hypothetical protein, conserved [Eimeria mitis]
MASPAKPRRRNNPSGAAAKPAAKKGKTTRRAAEPKKTKAAASHAETVKKTKNHTPAKAATPPKSSEAPQEHDIAALIDKQRRLQDEISSRQREILSLKELVTALSGGAVPLPVPVEVFYKLGQQFIEANPRVFSLTFPPLEQLQQPTADAAAGTAAAGTPTQAASGEPGEEENEEIQHARDTPNKQGSEQRQKTEGEQVVISRHGSGGQAYAEAAAKREMPELENEQEKYMHQQQQQLQQPQQQQQPQPLLQPQQPQQLLQPQHMHMHPQQLKQLQQQAQIGEPELQQELSLRVKLAAALSEQNEVLHAQARLLADAVASRDKRMEIVEEELNVLERKISSIAQKAEQIVTAAAANRRKLGEHLLLRNSTAAAGMGSGASDQAADLHTRLPFTETPAGKETEEDIKREDSLTPMNASNDSRKASRGSSVPCDTPTLAEEAASVSADYQGYLSREDCSPIEKKTAEALHADPRISLEPVFSPEGSANDHLRASEKTPAMGSSGEQCTVSPGCSLAPRYYPEVTPIDISASLGCLSPAEMQVLSREEAKLNRSAAAVNGCSNSTSAGCVSAASGYPKYNQLLVPSSGVCAASVKPEFKNAQQRGQTVQWQARS